MNEWFGISAFLFVLNIGLVACSLHWKNKYESTKQEEIKWI